MEQNEENKAAVAVSSSDWLENKWGTELHCSWRNLTWNGKRVAGPFWTSKCEDEAKRPLDALRLELKGLLEKGRTEYFDDGEQWPAPMWKHPKFRPIAFMFSNAKVSDGGETK